MTSNTSHSRTVRSFSDQRQQTNSSNANFTGSNKGLQIGQNLGPLTVTFNSAARGQNATILPYAAEALFTSYTWERKERCMPGTRDDLCWEIKLWANSSNTPRICWLRGLAGMGKSTIALTIAESLSGEKRLGASFIFSKQHGDISHARLFVTTIASQLARNIPNLRNSIERAIEENPEILDDGLGQQWKSLVWEPLAQLEGTKLDSDSDASSAPQWVIVIDALDECGREGDIPLIIKLLHQVEVLQNVQLRFFVTSRPDGLVLKAFERFPKPARLELDLGKYNNRRSFVDKRLPGLEGLALLEVDLERLDLDKLSSPKPEGIKEKDGDTGFSAVSQYLSYEIEKIRERQTEAKLTENDASRLTAKTGGSFINAATASRFIQYADDSDVQERLDFLLKDSNSKVSPEASVETTYSHILTYEFAGNQAGMEVETFKAVVGPLVVLFDTLSETALVRLTALPQHTVSSVLSKLESMISVPKDKTQPLQFLHISFQEFLLDASQSTIFCVDQKAIHALISKRCIELLSSSLSQDICKLNTPDAMVADIPIERIRQYLPMELQYACRYWAQHIHEGGIWLRDNDEFHLFLEMKLLHWFESLSLLRRSPETLSHLETIRCRIYLNEGLRFDHFINDARRFFLRHQPVISKFPLQTYLSALTFTPISSQVWKTFKETLCPDIDLSPSIQGGWGSLEQTFEMPKAVYNTKLSIDGTQILFTRSRFVEVWSLKTGQHDQTIGVCNEMVYKFNISPDGAKLALMREEFIEIWDVTTDSLEQTLDTSSCDGQPISVIFSSDGAKVMAAKKVDKADTIWVWIWNATTGQEECVFQYSREYIRKVLLFSDATRMVDCGSIIRILDVSSGEQVLQFQPRDSYDDILLSPENTSLAMAVRMQVHLWDTKTGQRKKVIKFHVDHFYFKFFGLAFSPDGTRIAAYTNVVIFIGNVATGQIEYALTTPGHQLDFLAFSPDGSHVISTDEAIRIWDLTMKQEQQFLIDAPFLLRSVGLSRDGSRVLFTNGDGSVSIQNVISGQIECELILDYQDLPRIAVLSHDSLKVAFGYRASYSDDMQWCVEVRDIATNRVEHQFGDLLDIRTLAFSANDTLLLASDQSNTHIWSLPTGQRIASWDGYSSSLAAFSSDASQVALLVWKELLVFCTTTGQAWKRIPVDDSHGLFNGLDQGIAVTPDASHVLTAHSGTGNLVETDSRPFECKIDNWSFFQLVDKLMFSSEGSKIISISRYNVCFWNSATGYLEHKIRPPSTIPNPTIIGISSDHTKVAVVQQYMHHIWIWDLPSMHVEHTLVGLQSFARDVVFSIDNSRVAAVFNEGRFMEWDTTTGELQYSFTCAALRDTESRMVCSPEGTVVIFPSPEGFIGILDAATGRERHIKTAPPSPIRRFQISPDGSLLAFVLDDTIRVWEVATAQEKYVLRTDSPCLIYCLDFSMDSSRLASANMSNIIHIWDLNTGSLDTTIYQDSTSQSIAFSPDGTKIVSNHHETLKVWQLTTDEEISQAFRRSWSTIKHLPFLPSQFNLVAWTGTSKRIKACCVQEALRICEDQIQDHDDFYSVDSSTEWVTHNGSRILHLPLDMRPRTVNARGNHLVLLSPQGELATLKFKSRRNTALP